MPTGKPYRKSSDPFAIAAKIFAAIRSQSPESLGRWNIRVGPPVHPGHFSLHPENSLVQGSALGGLQFYAQGATYCGRVLICLMEDGAYTVQSEYETLEKVPENLLCDVLGFLIMRKNRGTTPHPV